MGKDYVTKAEFDRFKDEDFKDLKADVSKLKDDLNAIRVNQAHTDSKIDTLSVEVKHVASALAEFKRVVCWGATVFVVPMLLLMHQILCAK
jgi:hypothetical protein